MARKLRVESNGCVIVPECNLLSYEPPDRFMTKLVSEASGEDDFGPLEYTLTDESGTFYTATLWSDGECPSSHFGA